MIRTRTRPPGNNRPNQAIAETEYIMNLRHGGKILIDQLAIQGCDTVFCVPGESFLAALDGLADSERIRTVVCRQEGGAAMMAEAHVQDDGTPRSGVRHPRTGSDQRRLRGARSDAVRRR